jgi:hypothetical protein
MMASHPWDACYFWEEPYQPDGDPNPRYEPTYGTVPDFWGVRRYDPNDPTNDYTFVRYHQYSIAPPNEFESSELYDNANDPNQLQNEFGNSSYSAKVTELETVLDTLLADVPYNR